MRTRLLLTQDAPVPAVDQLLPPPALDASPFAAFCRISHHRISLEVTTDPSRSHQVAAGGKRIRYLPTGATRMAKIGGVLVVLIVICLSGCAVISPPNFRSQPIPRGIPLPGAETVPTRLSVVDARHAQNPRLVEALEHALTVGLAARGFGIGRPGSTMRVAVTHVYLDEAVGTWSSQVSAEMIVSVHVSDAAKSPRFEGEFTGKSGPLDGLNFTLAQEKAYQDLLRVLLSDDELLRALLPPH